MDLGLKGKTIFITGGSNGIGKATALLLAAEKGLNIAISYFNNKENADAVVQQISASGNKGLAVYLDLADHNSIRQAAAEINNTFGGIDVLVNNAVQWGNPANRGKAFEELPIDQWQELISINLFGTILLTQLAVPHMRRSKWGRIINVSSDVGYDSMKGSGPYSTLKTALNGFTANLVIELSADGVLSNVVIPSWTLTDRALGNFPEAFRELAVKAYPTGRITTPQDIAATIAFLGSAANGHVNGEQIRVTGKNSQSMLASIFHDYTMNKK